MTMITEPRNPKVTAIFLKGHVAMFAAGMRNSRVTATTLRANVEKLTGKKYKRGDYTSMRADLQTIIDAPTEGQ